MLGQFRESLLSFIWQMLNHRLSDALVEATVNQRLGSHFLGVLQFRFELWDFLAGDFLGVLLHHGLDVFGDVKASWVHRQVNLGEVRVHLDRN